MKYTDPRSGVRYDVDEQGLLIEEKDNVPEVWEVIRHIEKYLQPPVQNGIYPKTRPAKRLGQRIELNCLGRWETFGLINILIYPAEWDIASKLELILDEAMTENIGLKLIVDRKESEVPGHMRIKYEHTKG
jgi:hypothetical protein